MVTHDDKGDYHVMTVKHATVSLMSDQGVQDGVPVLNKDDVLLVNGPISAPVTYPDNSQHILPVGVYIKDGEALGGPVPPTNDGSYFNTNNGIIGQLLPKDGEKEGKYFLQTYDAFMAERAVKKPDGTYATNDDGSIQLRTEDIGWAFQNGPVLVAAGVNQSTPSKIDGASTAIGYNDAGDLVVINVDKGADLQNVGEYFKKAGVKNAMFLNKGQAGYVSRDIDGVHTHGTIGEGTTTLHITLNPAATVAPEPEKSTEQVAPAATPAPTAAPEQSKEQAAPDATPAPTAAQKDYTTMSLNSTSSTREEFQQQAIEAARKVGSKLISEDEDPAEPREEIDVRETTEDLITLGFSNDKEIQAYLKKVNEEYGKFFDALPIEQQKKSVERAAAKLLDAANYDFLKNEKGEVFVATPLDPSAVAYLKSHLPTDKQIHDGVEELKKPVDKLDQRNGTLSSVIMNNEVDLNAPITPNLVQAMKDKDQGIK